MKKTILILAGLFLSISLYARNSGDTLKIEIFDSSTKEPLEAAIISTKEYGAIGITDSMGISYVDWKFFKQKIVLYIHTVCYNPKNVTVKYKATKAIVYLKKAKCDW